VNAFWLYLTLFLIILVTVRLARSQGRNPWLWGMASFLLMLSPGAWNLLSVVPIIILLVVRKPQPRPDAGPDRSVSGTPPTCPRCHTPNSADHRYCINCGWQLQKPYAPDSALATVPSSEAKVQSVTDQPDAEIVEVDPKASEPEHEAALKPVLERGEGEEPALGEIQTVGTPEPAGSEQRVSRGMPTAANMTERGLALFNQGRFQEAIDQFTKAIALDPQYVLAWAHRAEAYAQLGRGTEAAEDRRRLEALQGSPGWIP
jgi:hypothetical protein